jgi:PhoH-like ATPase
MMEEGTWMWGDIGTYYGTGVSGLIFYENVQSFEVSAGAAPGAAVNIKVSYPECPWMEFRYDCCTGKAGTGKTLLAFAAALEKANTYKQILLARPIVALANKDLGFLPGSEKDKIAPYMQPLFDNLNVIKHQFSAESREMNAINDMQHSGQLVIEALAYIRGRSLSDAYIIVDEAQNLTPHEIKTIITRAGENTKVVFTGDVQQIDHPYLDMLSNGLAYTIDKMKGQNIFAHVNLIKGERSYLSELASNLL